MNYSLMTPLLMTLVVTKSLLLLKVKSNPSMTTPVNLMKFKLKREMRMLLFQQ